MLMTLLKILHYISLPSFGGVTKSNIYKLMSDVGWGWW